MAAEGRKCPTSEKEIHSEIITWENIVKLTSQVRVFQEKKLSGRTLPAEWKAHTRVPNIAPLGNYPSLEALG